MPKELKTDNVEAVKNAEKDTPTATNNTVTKPAPAKEAKADEQKKADEQVEDRKDGAKEVDTKLGTSPEEKAAERAGVPEPALHNEKQNREPQNEFEKDNQKVTEKERKAAQEKSNMSTEKKIEKADEPKDAAKKDAAATAEVNQGEAIAQAITAGLKDAKGDGFQLKKDEGVDPRFTLVKDKDTGEVMIRENETGSLSQIQLKSIEEKEASIQSRKVEEL